MEFQDFDVGRKLPHIRAKNWQVIFWGVIVVLLIVVNVYVILYGRSKKEEAKQTRSLTQMDQYLAEGSQQTNPEPQKVITDFLAALNSDDPSGATQYLSQKTNPNSMDFYVVNDSRYRKFSYYILGSTTNRDKTISQVSVEIAIGSGKEYHNFTLFKEDAYWKVVDVRIVRGE